eukprot:gene26999-9017_t
MRGFVAARPSAKAPGVSSQRGHASLKVAKSPALRTRSRCMASSQISDAVLEDAVSLMDLRTQLKETDAKLAIEDANSKFYEAFRNGNLQAMEEVWGHGDHIQVVHPGLNSIAGRESVMSSWKSILTNIRPGAFKVKIEDVRIAASEHNGFVTCVEMMNADETQGM